MKPTWKVRVGGVLLATFLCAQAFAADDVTLVRILARADIAQNFAVYCSQYDPSIMERTRSKQGDMQSFMLHIRGEVVAGLPQDEAFGVVVRSADAARAGALIAIRKLYGQNPSEEHARLADWCEKSVVPSIKEFIDRHDEHHELFDEAIQKAKEQLQVPEGNVPSSREPTVPAK